MVAFLASCPDLSIYKFVWEYSEFVWEYGEKQEYEWSKGFSRSKPVYLQSNFSGR